MTENDVNLDIQSQAIRETGRPVHTNILARSAVRAWLETGAGERYYAPGAQYRAGETVLFNDQYATVKSVQEGGNPVQGSFTVLTLVLPDGTECLMAAQVPGAPAEDHRPATEAQLEATWRTQGAQARQAVQTALRADSRFVHYQSLQGDLWCLAEMLPQVRPTDLQKALATLPDELLNGELVSRTTEELVVTTWGLEDDGSDIYALHAFALSQALDRRQDAINLGDRWASARACETFTARPTLGTPRILVQVILPEGVEEPDAAQIEQIQQQETATQDEYDEGPEVKEPAEEKDLETWRRDHPTHAVFTLHARHYYEGWLLLRGQVQRLFPPLASGRQEVVFHHHFGDEPESLRALVDREQGRVWLSRKMYETFRRHRVYPGARLRLSARNEREFDIATRETDKTDPIRVWRMWLDEEGRIEYEEHQEPRLYDVSDDVYVADVRFEDLEALFRQAEGVGNSIFGLMYQQAAEWWEAGGREDLLVTADRLFEAVHFDEQGRMTSKATIAWELWRRLAFESVGSGRYRFRPEFGSRVRSVKPASRRPPRPTEPISGCWPQVARLAGHELYTLSQRKPFRVLQVGNNTLQIQVEASGETWGIQRKKIEAAWEHLAREGEISRAEIQNQYLRFNSTYVAAILAALPDVTHQVRPIRLTYQPPSEEPLTPAAPTLERTRTGQLVAADLVPPGPLFQEHPQPPQPSSPELGDGKPESAIEAEFRQIQEIVRSSLVGKTVHTLVRHKPNRITGADEEGLTVVTEKSIAKAGKDVPKVPWEWIRKVYERLCDLGRVDYQVLQEGALRSQVGFRKAFIFALLSQFAHIEGHKKPRSSLTYHKPEGAVRLRDAERETAPPAPSAGGTHEPEPTQVPAPIDAPGPPSPPPSHTPTPTHTHPRSRRDDMQTKTLFSSHYLENRLPDHPEWTEDPRPVFDVVRGLWQKTRQYGDSWNEAQTEEEFIKPVLKALGWSFIVQPKARRRGRTTRPDYALFADNATRQAAYPHQEDDDAFYSRALAIAEAKYWGRPLSQKDQSGRDAWKAGGNPSHQMVSYLVGTRTPWGILTNGRTWRLYSREVSSTASEFYEVDLGLLFDFLPPASGGDERGGEPSPTQLDQFRRWWLFFRRDAFTPDSH